MEQLDLFTGRVSEQNSSFPYYRFDTPDELELLLSRLTIVEVGLFYLRDEIKKRPVSPNYKGLCPFHKERTPSFYVKPGKNRYVCYGCKSEGGPLSLDHYLGGVAYDHITRIAKIDEIMHFTSDPHLIVIPPETTDKQKEFIKIIQEAISREGHYF